MLLLQILLDGALGGVDADQAEPAVAGVDEPVNAQPPGRQGLVVGFAGAPADELRAGVRVLARALLGNE